MWTTILRIRSSALVGVAGPTAGGPGTHRRGGIRTARRCETLPSSTSVAGRQAGGEGCKTIRDWYLPRGRVSRPDFLLRYFLPVGAAGSAAGIADSALGLARPASEGWTAWGYFGGPLSLCLVVLTVVPLVAALVGRLHDCGYSARRLWWLVLPLPGWWLVFFDVWCRAGDGGENRHGPPPAGGDPWLDVSAPRRDRAERRG